MLAYAEERFPFKTSNRNGVFSDMAELCRSGDGATEPGGPRNRLKTADGIGLFSSFTTS